MSTMQNESTVQFNIGDEVRVITRDQFRGLSYQATDVMVGNVYRINLVDNSDNTVRLATLGDSVWVPVEAVRSVKDEVIRSGSTVTVVSMDRGPKTPERYGAKPDMLGMSGTVVNIDDGDDTVMVRFSDDNARWVARAGLRVGSVVVGAEDALRQVAVDTGAFHGPLSAEQARIEELVARVGTLQDNLTSQAARAAAAETALAEFKSQVALVASRYAQQHDWCSVVDEALGEVGLERVPMKHKVRMRLTVEVEAEVENADDEHQAATWFENGVTFDFDSTDGDVRSFDYDNTRWELIEVTELMED